MVRHATLVLVASLLAAPLASHAQPRRDRPAAPAAAEPAPPAAATVKSTTHLVSPLTFDRVGSAEGLPNSHVLAIVQDKLGFMWFGTQDGLARYDGARMKVYRPSETDPASLSAAYITALALDADGKVWIGTGENGANLYDPATDRFTRFLPGQPGSVSSGGITAILRDRKDRVWFAMSGGGLDRYQPETKSFKTYKTAPLDGAITALDADPAGNLWLGTATAGLVRWNPDDGSTATYPLEEANGAAVAAITEVKVAASGIVWIGTDGGGLFAFDPKTQKATRHRHDPAEPTSISDDHITVLFEDRAKTLWVGTINGLNHLDAQNKAARYYHDPEDPRSLAFQGIESITQDAGGVMWFGGFILGVCKYDGVTSTLGRHRTRTHAPNSFFEDTDGAVWIGTYHGGLYRYDWAASKVTLYTVLANPSGEKLALESAWITSVHRDRRGLLWMTIQGQGLVALDTKTDTYTQYLPDPERPTSLPVDTAWKVWDDDEGKLWIASWGGGLVAFDPQTEEFSSLTTEDQAGLTSNHLYTLHPDPTDANILWIGAAEGGVIRFDMATAKATAFRHKDDDPASLSSDDVLTIYKDPKGPLWVGTYGGGLNKIDPATGKAQRFTTSNSGLSNDVIFGVLPDVDGNLWMSTNGGGVASLSADGKTWAIYDATDGLQGNEFGQNAFMRTKAGRMFFGGVDGFNAFVPKEIVRDAYVPPVSLTGFKQFNQEVRLARPIWTLPSIKVSYADSFEVQFAALSYAAPGKNRYAYKLEGFDEKFIETDRPYATYTKLDGGNYTLRVRAANRHGVWNEAGVALTVKVTPPIWRTWPAYVLYMLLLAGAAALVIYLQRQRVRRVEREGRLAVVERDLALTGAVQSGFLPEYNEIGGERVQLYGYYRGADTCSGDWWWHEALPGRHHVLVGDVTGHGPGPAMVTAAVSTAFQVLAANGISDLREALELLNKVVLQVAKGKYSMTMAAFELNEYTGEWVLHSAGAPPIMSAGQNGKHKIHFCAGTPLGTDGTFEPGRLEGRLQPFERILIYTDGIPELVMTSGQALGMRRLGQMFERTVGQDLRVTAQSIVKQADLARAGQPQDDDWTFAVVEWRGAQRSNG